MENRKLQDLAKAKLELIKRSAWDDFYFFAKYVCGRELIEEQPHRELCEFLTAGLDKTETLSLNFTAPMTNEYVREKCQKLLKKLIMLPRGSFKSTIASNALPIWLLWHNQNLRIMIDSETLSNAKMYLAGIRDMIENNELLKMVCADKEGNYLLEPNKSIAGGFTEEQIILKHRTKLGLKEPTLFCSGVDNARTGMHPDVIIMDDLVSERNVGTEIQLEKVKDHYRFSLSLLEPGGLHLIIGTRYHMADLYGELIDVGAFDTLIRPAKNDDGELYFPARLTQEFLDEQKKSQGSYIFSCQYMLRPVDDSNAIFKRDNIKYYSDKPDIIAKYIMIDLAISQRETADYFVVLCAGIDRGKNIYVLDYIRNRCLPKQQIDHIFNMFTSQNSDGMIKAVGIETVAYQKAMMYLLKDEMKRRGVHMPLKELKADKDKIRRVQALQPLFENHEVFIRTSHVELEQELLEFPLSKHDDVVDALAYIMQLLRAGSINTLKNKYKYTPTNRFVNY
jgi:predicted phage terminase large subunit-like protein